MNKVKVCTSCKYYISDGEFGNRCSKIKKRNFSVWDAEDCDYFRIVGKYDNVRN